MDQSAETQNLIGPFQHGVTISTEEKPEKRRAKAQRSASATPKAGDLTCPYCHEPVRTPSELKKHKARHQKPFKCDVPDCPKASEGFSTNNDLDRHKQCKHGMFKGVKTVYRCNLDRCKDKSKDWPRQDNFKAHLKRIHKMDDAADLGPFTHRLSSSTDLAGLATSETIASEDGRSMDRNPASPLPWTEQDPGTAAPARLLNAPTGDPEFTETSNAIRFMSHTRLLEEGGLSPLRRAHMTQFIRAQNLSQNTPLTGQDITPLFATFYGSGGSLQISRATSTEETPLAEQAPCVVPDVLCHTGTEFRSSAPSQDTQIHPSEAMQLDEDDILEVVKEHSEPGHQKVERGLPNETAVEEPSENAASEDGLHDTDVENSSPESPDGEAVKLSPGYDLGSASAPEPIVKASPTEPEQGIDMIKRLDLSEEGSVIVRSLMAQGMLEKVLMEVGFLKPPEPETEGQPPPVNPPVPSDKNRVKCDKCHKTFQRRCELKKHRKRHAKPYACTFAMCTKTFGSKNDWKRHETSQHCQLEIWRCDEPSLDRPGEECGKACHRREFLKSHLEKGHDIRDHDTLEKKLADCRMGPNFESRFWCGFCRKIIEPAGKVGPAHGERFDHVDDHFNGRGMPKADIKDWKYVDAEPLDGLGTPELGKPGKRSRDSDDDDAAATVRLKRTKGEDNQRDIYWTCCRCGYYWTRETTSRCMESSCDHTRCPSCTVFVAGPTNEQEARRRRVDDLMTAMI
ncbi:hypothetical protein MFIFM68171_04163 [Madurella fahalii]|uniref:C2H2-type domain-containing protein n=1 Tax=Madurella fahalii TaxID=1157608 RepID=A0ABQ0G863_9PEZI